MKVITKLAPKQVRGKNLTVVWGIHDGFRIGKLLIAQTADGVCWLSFGTKPDALYKAFPGADFIEDKKVTAKAASELAKRWPNSLDDYSLPLVLYGTAFQQKVWKELLKIKSGKTLTYSDIAAKIGHPDAHRAVGSAVGKNPVSLIVPCHRVINRNGGKVNYAWGPEIKLALLKGEGVAI